MNLKVSTRQVDGVSIVDCSGRITLGEGSVVLRDTVKDLLAKGQKEDSAEPRRRELHRQLRDRRTGQRLYHGEEPGRRTEAAQADQESA